MQNEKIEKDENRFPATDRSGNVIENQPPLRYGDPQNGASRVA